MESAGRPARHVRFTIVVVGQRATISQPSTGDPDQGAQLSHASQHGAQSNSGTSYHFCNRADTVLLMSATPAFTRLPHPSPMSPQQRAEVLATPGFGRYFTDHMVEICWTRDRDWH